MKNIGKLCSLFLAVALSLSLITIPAFASDSNNTISFDEYSQLLKEEYKKYGIDFEVIPLDKNTTYTSEQLEEQLAFAKEFADSITITCVDRSISTQPKSSNTAKRVMESDFYYRADFTVSSGVLTIPSTAHFELDCIGTYNMQNGNVMYVSDCSVHHIYSANLASYDGIYADYSINSQDWHQMVTVLAMGELTFEWTDPWTSSTQKATVYGPFFKDTFDPADYD